MIGQIVPAGTINPRWMFVTRERNGALFGRLWSARSGTWSKGECTVGFAREAIFKETPCCPQPAASRDL